MRYCIPYFITNSLYNLKNIIILLYKKLSKFIKKFGINLIKI